MRISFESPDEGLAPAPTAPIMDRIEAERSTRLPLGRDEPEETMSKMVVIYRKPADPRSFDDHYFNVHVPLAKQLPDLLRYEVSRGPIAGRFSGDAPHLVATLHFATMTEIQAAFASEVGKACMADVRTFAPNEGDMTMFLFEDETV